MQEKSQDNVNKRSAVEKEPLTLETDKEDQSKYYLSHPKLPVSVQRTFSKNTVQLVRRVRTTAGRFTELLNLANLTKICSAL